MAISDNLMAALDLTMQKYGPAIVSGIKDNLRRNNKVASGELMGSINFQIKKFDDVISLQILAADYLKWVDEGRQKGKFPPIAQILKWIQVKGIRPRGIARKSRTSLKKQQKKLAYLIARGIARKGIKPTKIIDPVLDTVGQTLYVEISETISITIGREIGQQLADAAKEIAGKHIKVHTNINTGI